MKYGWIGKKAVMLVEKHTFNKEEIKELKSMFENHKLSNIGVGEMYAGRPAMKCQLGN